MNILHVISTAFATIAVAAVVESEHVAAALLMSVIPLAAFMCAVGIIRAKLQALKMAKHDFIKHKTQKYQDIIEDHQITIGLLVFALVVLSLMLYAIFSTALSRMGA
ncbi:hypothetical protein HUZ36_04675 [Pseudoalteromonas sp. McH1-7]|uniref:hypothetical protein n=1 Tax=Pseudoalteromonas sp. McH1-7 TaxID=2745574 RepID=UPI0015910EEF|nr:hypothetical protein [Pseudoalteromonas sp. McH1-7]NUZ10068.1 hypothetical protein [Pseudoalteromonas sp. McH1-7]